MCYFLDSHRSTQDMLSLRHQEAPAQSCDPYLQTAWAGLQVWITWLKQCAASCQDVGWSALSQPPVAWRGPGWCCGRWRGRGRMVAGSGSPGELLGPMGKCPHDPSQWDVEKLVSIFTSHRGRMPFLPTVGLRLRIIHQSSDPEDRIWTGGPDCVWGNFLFEPKPPFKGWI